MLRAGVTCLLLALSMSGSLEEQDKSEPFRLENCPSIDTLNYTLNRFDSYVDVALQWKHPTISVASVSSYNFEVCASEPCVSYDVSSQETHLTVRNVDYWADFNVYGYAYCQFEDATIRSEATTLNVDTGHGGPRKPAYVSAVATSPTTVQLSWFDSANNRKKPDNYNISICDTTSSCLNLTVLQNGSEVYHVPIVKLETDTDYTIYVSGVIRDDKLVLKGPSAEAYVSTPKFPYNPIRGLNYTLERKNASVNVKLWWYHAVSKKTPCCTKIEVCREDDCSVHEVLNATQLVLQDQEFWSTFIVNGYACYEEIDATVCSNATQIQVETGPGNPRKPAYAHVEASSPTTLVVDWVDPTKGRRAPDKYYVVVCTSDGKCRAPIVKEYKRDETYAVTIGDLLVDTLYNTKITAVIGYNGTTYTSLPAEIRVTTPKSSFLAPENFNAKVIKKEKLADILLTWEVPAHANPNLVGYKFEVCSHGKNCSILTSRVGKKVSVENVNYWTDFVVTGYAVYKDYGATIESPPVTVSVSTGPVAPWVDNLYVKAESSNSILVRWDGPHNGHVTSFNLSACPTDGETCTTAMVPSTPVDVYQEVFGALEPWTNYTISVFAVYNDSGHTYQGPTVHQFARTLPGAPDAVRNATIRLSHLTVVNISWIKPAVLRGPLDGYFVHCTTVHEAIPVTVKDTVARDVTSVVIDLTEQQSNFECDISPFNCVPPDTRIYGKESLLHVHTEGIPSPKHLNITNYNSTTVTLEWDVNPEAKNFSIHVLKDAQDMQLYNIESHDIATRTNNTHKHVITHLAPWTPYDILVSDCSSYCGKASKLHLRTDVAAPSQVLNFSTLVTHLVDLRFQWKAPKHRNGPLDGYRLVISSLESSEKIAFTLSGNETDLQANISNFYTKYQASIAAYNDDSRHGRIVFGSELSTNFTTKGPGPAPPYPETSDLEDKSAVIEWHKPADDVHKIVAYEVYVLHGESEVVFNSTTKATNVTVTGLQPWTLYDAHVSSCEQKKRCGPVFKMLKFRTDVDAPSAPRDLNATDIGVTWIRVVWKEPEFPYGPIDGYEVEWNNGSVNSSTITKSTSFNITHLPSGTSCTIRVSAFNNGYHEEKRGKAAHVTAVTATAPTGVSRTTIILAVLLPLIGIVLCIIGYLVYKRQKKRNVHSLLVESE